MKSCGNCGHSRPTDSPDLVLLVKPCPYANCTTDAHDKACKEWKDRTK